MFVGTINGQVRKFLASQARWFDKRRVVIGCSGNFTSEATLRAAGFQGEVHSNDVSLYSCMLGRLLTGQPVEYEVIEAQFDWLTPYMGGDFQRAAVLLVLQDMLPFEKAEYRGHVRQHRVRMWENYREQFGELVEQTARGLLNLVNTGAIAPTSFFAGDVFEHFKRFEHDPEAVFLCWLPTYTGGYERLYKRLDQIFKWQAPVYSLIDEGGRDALLKWVQARNFIWYDDRRVEGSAPVFEQEARRKRTVWLYSNLPVEKVFVTDRKNEALPGLPLAGEDLEITFKSRVEVRPIKPKLVEPYKDAYLAKNMIWGRDDWSYMVLIDGKVIGFFGVQRGKNTLLDQAVLNSEIALPGTRYARLSKLIAMLAWSKQTHTLVERAHEMRIKRMVTSVYSERTGSMVLRGVVPKLSERQDAYGRRVMIYGGDFNKKTWKQTLHEWIQKYGTVTTKSVVTEMSPEPLPN